MNYTLKRKDISLAVFDTQGSVIARCLIANGIESLLPLPLKRLVSHGYREEFIAEITPSYYELNDDGCTMFNEWLADREIPVNRVNYDSYVKKNSTARKLLFTNHGYSFDDCYWVESETEHLLWSDIENCMNTLDTIYAVKDSNGTYKGSNATLGGQLEKFWFKHNNDVMLCKKTRPNDIVLSAREVVASLIYSRLACIDYCAYQFIKHHDGTIAGCVCKAFTDSRVELITAYDLLEEFNYTQRDDVWEQIIKLAENYGLSSNVTRRYLEIQTIVDYLITNRDRHQGNIGFLRDTDTLRIIRPAPIFDNGSSAAYESEIPEGVRDTTVNGLYSTELECLAHIRDFLCIDLSKLPSADEIGNIYGACADITEHRKQVLRELYRDKVNFLHELQSMFLQGENVPEYLMEIVRKPKEFDFGIEF